MFELLTNFVNLFTESAPWLLLGLLIAGIMKWVVPFEILQRHMGSNNMLSIIKSALIGAPLPLCSCGVIPAAIGLRRAGASKSASISFLVATPETGVDSISVSYALLGPFMAIIRPVSAILSAIYAGVLVMFVTRTEQKSMQNEVELNQIDSNPLPSQNKTGSCCSKVEQKKEKTSCCNSAKKAEPDSSWYNKLKNILSFASGKLLKDITLWLMIGLSLAAAIKTWVPTDVLTQWGGGFTAMMVMALIGIPMYICATASTPVAAGFLAVGVSPGAVLVFMLAGPATNLSTMGMIRQEMGVRVLLVYLFSILSASIGIGYFANWAIELYQFEVFQVAANTHSMSTSLVHQLAALTLAGLILRNLILSRISIR